MDIKLRSKGTLFIKHFADKAHPLYAAIERLLHSSDYANRHYLHLLHLVEEDDCQHALSKIDYQRCIASISSELPPHLFGRALRQFRHRYLLRIALREIAMLASTEESMASWSSCADVILLYTLHYCSQQLIPRYGQPRNEKGELVELYTLAMGKLGGNELNFSSDIDLIFAFSGAGYTDGQEPIANQHYFTKVVQQAIQLLQTITEDGFVFRVDLRLRPNGDSGPLVYTLAAMETYYQEQGRDWERYAMVKARPIRLDNTIEPWFQRLIIPFVYRRYVDFSVIESLRGMKAMIEREVQLNPMLDDIKRGRGGIREIEFIIQCFQLIRGGRLPSLRHTNAKEALTALKKEGLLAHTDALQKAYLFLRKLENAIQLQNDQQTHSLPTDPIKQAQLVCLLNEPNWERLINQLQQYQRIVGHSFHAVLSKEHVYQDEKRLLANQLISLWQGHIESTMAVNLLASLNFKEAQRCYQMLQAFRMSARCRRLSQAARIRLDHLMVLLLSELMHVEKTDSVLLQALRLLENIVGRSAYLALLTENVVVVKELLHWFAHSPFITSLLVSQPFLLEVLLDQQQSWAPQSLPPLKKLLQQKLSHCHEVELQEDMLRQFKLTNWLLAARAELYGHYDAVRIGQFLADVAEAIIHTVVDMAYQQLADRYPEINRIKSQFALLAYGKLGSREINYDSDMDLVFLHNASPEDENLVTRLTQKILHMLTTRSQTGFLYWVDTRLRPSGSAGLLVSHLDAFTDYQRSRAWTWEHQALLRARVVVGSQKIKRTFYQLKKDIVLKPRDKKQLSNEIKTMRLKIEQHADSNPIKHDPGGLLDLEFLTQFLVLAYPQACLIEETSTIGQLQQLYKAKVLTKAQFKSLTKAYCTYHQALHQQVLQPGKEPGRSEQEVVAISRVFME